MIKTKSVSSVDIVSCLLEGHRSLKEQLFELRSKKAGMAQMREALDQLAAFLAVHTHAEDEVLFSHSLEKEKLQEKVRVALEEHEVLEIEITRVKQSADEGQWEARLKVFCNLLEHFMKEKEEKLFPELLSRISAEERKEMGMRYREIKERNDLAAVLKMPEHEQGSILASETGRIGYIIAWLLGVPFWVLLLVFLIRGH